MITGDSLRDALYAIHNFGYADTHHGRRWEMGVRAGLNTLYLYPEGSPERQGLESVFKLVGACLSAPDPEAYLNEQIQLGLSGARAE